ncbi:MAG TPA: TIGR02453 family protein [Candidatus Binataceae bacterium]|nr:TIGR02453 family protein [Candidatus Binataceae bacterium]
MAASRYFSPAFFEFFEELSRNNNREWFQHNKSRYEDEVRTPMLRFIADFAPRLRAIGKHFDADPRPTGGSMMRIYRNLRFSRDKTPYRTNAAAAFHHRDADFGATPAFYLSLSPAEAFAGVGLFHPTPDTLEKMRRSIVARPAIWKRAVGDKKFLKRFNIEGDSLTRPPRGFDPEHPLIEDIKRKDFIGGAQFTRAEVCSPRFLELYTELCKSASPYVKFITEAVGLRW